MGSTLDGTEEKMIQRPHLLEQPRQQTPDKLEHHRVELLARDTSVPLTSCCGVEKKAERARSGGRQSLKAEL